MLQCEKIITACRCCC